MPTLVPVKGNPFKPLSPEDKGKAILDIFDPKDDGGAVPVITSDPEVRVKQPKLTPVAHNPFKLTPVKGDPFKGDTKVAPTTAPTAVAEPNAGESSPGYLESVEKATIDPLAGVGRTLIAPFLSEKNQQKLQKKGLISDNKSKTLAQAVNEGPVGQAATALYTGITAPISPLISDAVGKAEKSGQLKPGTMDTINAILNIASIGGVPGARGAKVGEAAQGGRSKLSTPTPETQMAEIERRMDKGEIPPEQAHAQMEALRQHIQPAAPETQPKYTPHPNEVKMAEIEARMDKGKIPRDQAMAQMEELRQGIPPKLTPVEGNPFETSAKTSAIFTPDEGVASTKPLTSTRGVADRLFAEKNRGLTDQAELKSWIETDPHMKQLAGNTELQEYFQKHQDNPVKYPLSPEQKTIFDNTIGVIRKERDVAKNAITKAGFNPDEAIEEPASENLGGATRQVVGKGTPMDRLLGIKSGAPVGPKSLSKSAGSLKSRSMMALDTPEGRKIVHVTDTGDVVDAANPQQVLGKSSQLPLKQATIEEIEKATGGKIPYHKNALGVEITALLQERRAARNIKLLQELPKSSGAADVMRGPGTKFKSIPKGWVEIPNLPVFRGYHFEPEFAEEIQDHLNSVKAKDGLMRALESTNNFMKSAFFWLNPAHAYNVAEAFAVSKGALGFAKDLPGTATDFAKSLKSVITRDKTYIKGARAGVPYRGLDSITQKFNRSLLDAMGERARQDPKNFMEFAKEFGFNKPTDLIKRVAEISHDVPFGLQDILQQTLERGMARRGVSQAQATEEIARTLPNYRTQSRYLGSRTLGQAAKGSAFLQFPGWDIGRLQGLAKILKGSAKLDLKSLDQLLMIGVLYEFGSQVINPIIQQETGNKNAEGPTAGYGTFVKNSHDVYAGNKTPFQAAESLFPFGYLPRAAMSGINTYTGKQTSLPGETAKEVAFDYGSKFAEQFDPIKRFIDVATGKASIREEALKQVGIKSPSAAEVTAKNKAKRYIKHELANKRKKEPEWIRP